MKNEKPRLGVLVKFDANDNTFDNRLTTWCRAIPVLITSDRGELAFTYATPSAALKTVLLKTLLCSDIAADSQTLGGGDVIADSIYSASLYELEAIVKGMKDIHKAMKKLDALVGYPASFGAMTVRFANAIGADLIVTLRDEQQQRGENGRWRYDTLEDGVRRVDRIVSDWNKKYSPAHQQVTA